MLLSKLSTLFLFYFLTSNLFAEDITNCNRCHSNYKKLSNPLPLKSPHQNLQMNHVEQAQRCSICHSSQSPNKLVMLDGTVLNYQNAPQLCGQCHGSIYIDWSQGIHGKKILSPATKIKKLQCSECHNAHSPQFKKMKADPPPHRPHFGIIKEQSEKISDLEKKDLHGK